MPDMDSTLSSLSLTMEATVVDIPLEERVSLFDMKKITKLHRNYRRYFDVLGMVHSVAVTLRNRIVLSIFCGVKFDPPPHSRDKILFHLDPGYIKEYVSPPNPLLGPILTNFSGKDYIAHLDIYDDHVPSTVTLKSGDFVIVTNVHYAVMPRMAALQVHRGRGSLFRGVYHVPTDSEFPKFLEIKRLVTEALGGPEILEKLTDAIEQERIKEENEHNAKKDRTIEQELSFTEDVLKEEDELLKDVLSPELPKEPIKVSKGAVFHNISVDRFVKRDKCKYHFLTHAHSDHITGLKSSWDTPIYCSIETARIVNILTRQKRDPGLAPKYIIPMELGVEYEFDGFTVQALDANHCVGAVMFVFRGTIINGGAILVTGDFRADTTLLTRIREEPIYKVLTETHYGTIYMDNTYLDIDTAESFIDRKEALKVITAKLEAVRDTDIIFPLNKLGREEILEDLFDFMKTPMELYSVRQNVADALHLKHGSKDYRGKKDVNGNRIVVVPRQPQHIRSEIPKERKYIIIDMTMMIKPLGLTDDEKQNYFHVGYSDHSSRTELFNFIQKISFENIIPTSADMSQLSMKQLKSHKKKLSEIEHITPSQAPKVVVERRYVPEPKIIPIQRVREERPEPKLDGPLQLDEQTLKRLNRLNKRDSEGPPQKREVEQVAVRRLNLVYYQSFRAPGVPPPKKRRLDDPESERMPRFDRIMLDGDRNLITVEPTNLDEFTMAPCTSGKPIPLRITGPDYMKWLKSIKVLADKLSSKPFVPKPEDIQGPVMTKK